MKINFRIKWWLPFCLCVIFTPSFWLSVEANAGEVEVYLTTLDAKNLLSRQTSIKISAKSPARSSFRTIEVQPNVKFQKIEGFGASISDTSAFLMHNKLSESQRRQLMLKVFDKKYGIGLSFLRQPIHETDYSLCKRDSLDSQLGLVPDCPNFDTEFIIPLLQKAIQINPELNVMLTPWTAPPRFKTNRTILGGGSLDSQSYSLYAEFIADFVQNYENNGIPVHALSVQNEPLYMTSQYPTMSMEWYEEFNFIYYSLGPQLKKRKLLPKLLIFDHNWDLDDYARVLLKNEGGKIIPWIGGVAYHCYGGDPSVMGELHRSYPNLDLYLTECSDWSPKESDPHQIDIRWAAHHLLINSIRNWAKTIVRWNLALDENRGPMIRGNQVVGGGLPLGLVEIDTRQNPSKVSYLGSYYALGHLSRFVSVGAYRIESTHENGGIESVAFLNPDFSRVLLVYNAGRSSQQILVKEGERSFVYKLPSGAVATFKWSPAN